MQALQGFLFGRDFPFWGKEVFLRTKEHLFNNNFEFFVLFNGQFELFSNFYFPFENFVTDDSGVFCNFCSSFNEHFELIFELSISVEKFCHGF